MKRHRTRSIPAFLVFAFICLAASYAFASTMYEITFTNLSNNVLTPAPFITHDASFDLFTEGQSASAGVEALAEGGDTSGVLALATAGQGSGSVLDFDTALNGGPILPGESASVTIETDAAHPYLSFLSMLAFTNDAFLGVTTGDGAIDLFSGGTPTSQDFVFYAQDVWDAGTEVNDELASTVPALGGMGGIDEIGGVLTLGQHQGILGVGDVPLDRNFIDGPIAQLTVDPVPEPATLLLFGAGLTSLTLVSRRKKEIKT